MFVMHLFAERRERHTSWENGKDNTIGNLNEERVNA